MTKKSSKAGVGAGVGVKAEAGVRKPVSLSDLPPAEERRAAAQARRAAGTTEGRFLRADIAVCPVCSRKHERMLFQRRDPAAEGAADWPYVGQCPEKRGRDVLLRFTGDDAAPFEVKRKGH